MTAVTAGAVTVRPLDGAADADADTTDDDAVWGALVEGRDFFQLPSWLRVVRRVAGQQVERWVAEHRGEVVAGIAAVPATSESPWLLVRPDTVLAAAVDDDLPGAAQVAAALSGAPLLPGVVAGGRHVGRTRVVGPGATEPAVLHDLLAAVEARARATGARCVCLPHVDVGDPADPADDSADPSGDTAGAAADPVLARVLTERGYLGHDAAGYAWLPVPAGGMDEYMAGLSQHRRRHIRVAHRTLDAAGVTIRCVPLPSLPTSAVAVLGEQEAQLQHKYGNPADAATSTRLLEIVRDEIGDDALVSLAERDGRILGFGLVLRSDGHWFGHRAGFDYAGQGELPLYEPVLYYAVLDEAARQGAAVLHVGVGSDAAKRSLRCASSVQRSFVLPLEAS